MILFVALSSVFLNIYWVFIMTGWGRTGRRRNAIRIGDR
jgi:hypothetical protein